MNVGPSSVVLQDQDTLPLSNLQLSASTVTLAPNTSLRLMFNAVAGDWIQEGANADTAAVRGLKCGRGTMTAAGATVQETLASYTFAADEARPGDQLRVTAFWQHMPGTNGTLDTAFRTQLKLGSAVLPETCMPAPTDTSLFSEYWIYLSDASHAAVQRHFRTANNAVLPTTTAASLNVSLANAAVSLQARPTDAPGSDDMVALTGYCIELVKGNQNGY